jgi:hypothetical protein
MKVKFKTLLTVLGCIGNALIGTQIYALDSTANPTQRKGVYIAGLAGYNRYGLRYIANPNDDWTNGRGNFAFGAAAGYQCSKYFSVEAGGIYTFDGKARNPLSVDPTKDEILKTRYAYLVGKLSVMTYPNTTIFTKLGLGYQHLSVSNGPFGKEKLRKWGAMFGAGTAYYFTPKVFINLQWLRFTGKVVDGAGHVTAPNIFLLGLGYKF